MTEREIFLAALEMATPEARAVYLQGICGQNATLHRKVEELLKEHFSNDGLRAEPMPGADRPTVKRDLDSDAAPAQMLGRYKLLEKIGEGGFGEVWMAEQREPVKRRVALKIIKLGMDSRQIVNRFAAERQALALMDHGNIAKIFDAGMTETGRPYFVMELVRGIKITEYCEQNQLPTHERLRLFILVCQAIQHAHQKGIIHRDIKPSNILVSLHDGLPMPKVIDFGIAKATQQELTDKTVFTQFQQFLGTPAYISPEQAEMSGLDIDTRADIYSLGVLLYELLVGQTPFDAKEMMQGGLDALRQIIREWEPLRPSKAVERRLELRVERSTGRETKAETLNSQLKPLSTDLDWIVMKCLEKDRTRRYDTANGLAMDIQRHLSHEPVVARPPSAAYKFQKAWQRNKLAFTAGAAVALALVAGISVSTWQTVEATKAKKAEVNQRVAAQEAQGTALVKQREAEEARAAEAAQRRLAEARAYAADMNVAHQAVTENNLGRAVRLLKEYIPKPGEQDLRGFEWRYLWQQCQGDELATFAGHRGRVSCAVFSPDGRTLVTAGYDKTVTVWNFATRSVVTNLTIFRTAIAQVAFSPDGTVLAVADANDQITLWDTTGWRLRQEINELPSGRLPIAFSPTERTLAVRTRSGVTLWDVMTGEKKNSRLEVPGGGGYAPLIYAPDGRTLATADEREIQIWDVRSNSIVARCASPFFEPIAMTFSSSGDRLFAADWNGTVKIWSLPTGEERPSKIADANSNFIFAMACSPDGRILALAGSGQLIDLWDLATQTKIGSLKGHLHEVWTLAFAPDGQSLVSASKDGTAKLWRPEPKLASYTLTRSALEVRLTLDGNSLLAMTTNGTIQQWNTRTRELSETFDIPLPLNSIRARICSWDGELAAFALRDGTIRIRNLRAKTWNQTLTNQWGNAYGIEFSPRRPVLAAACLKTNMNGARQYTIELWDLASKPAMTPYKDVSADYFGRLTFSVDGERLAVVGTDDSLQMIDIGPQTARTVIPRLGLISMALSPDQSQLATTSDNEIHLWDMKSGQVTHVLQGHRQNVTVVTFSPDGMTLASSAESGAIKFWSVGTGKELFTLRGFEDNQDAVVFSSDGNLLARLGRRAGRGSVSLIRVPSLPEIDATLNLTRTGASK